MPKGIVATMDTLGYLTEPTVKADRAIAYWFANRVDQCIILRDIASYQFIVAKHQNDPSEERFLEDIRNNLREYLLEIYDKVSVDAWAKRQEEGDKMFTLVLSAEFYQDGIRYELSKSVLLAGETYKVIDAGRENKYGR